MTPQEYLKEREAVQSKLTAFKKQIEKEFEPFHIKFLEANCPVELDAVYELKENGVKRRGFNRFVIYERQVSVFGGDPMIRVGGWWLNAKSIPTKWDTMTVYGVANPAVFELSKDQTNLPHPQSKQPS